MKYDVLVIGAGAVGCSLARELSRYDLKAAVLEKESDVAAETSGRNSAVVHAGFNNKPGSLMAKFCVEGNKGFEAICKELDIPYFKTGKILVAFDENDMKTLASLVEQGTKNGCEGLKLVSKEELDCLMPGLGGIGAMHSPNTAIFNPFLYCVSMAENAVDNGVEFYLNSEVTSISKENGYFVVKAGDKIFESKYVVNCAGLFCDKISEMAGVPGYHIYPCRGEYLILDKPQGFSTAKDDFPILPVYPAPRKGIGGLGVHLTPTTDGNIIIGPSAEYIEDNCDYSSTPQIMKKLIAEAKALLPSINDSQVIGAYSGIRPKQAPPGEGGFRDFVIKEEPSQKGFINLIGIESPGFTASVPIAKMVIDIISQSESLKKKENFNPYHKNIVAFRDLTESEQEKLIAEDPEYGDIICRCQKVSKHEIRQAIENPLGARSISAIKYRAWPTTGRCNGGYCLAKIARMLVDEYGMKPEEILYRSEGSNMFSGEVK